MRARFFLHSRGIYLTVWAVLLGIGVLSVSVCKVGSIGFSIGTSLIAASLVSFGQFWATFLTEPLDQARTHIEEAGLADIHKRRDINTRYAEILRSAQKVDVAGYSLRGFLDNHRDLLLARAQTDNAFRLRIIIIDPESPTARDRVRFEEQADAHFAQQLQRLQTTFRNIGHVQIRLVQQPLSTMIFRLDDTLFFGPYFTTPSSATITFECSSRGWAFEKHMTEFEAMWLRGIAVHL